MENARQALAEIQQKELDDAYRANGECVCEICGKEYRSHPEAREPHLLGFNDEPYLNRLCNGDLIHL